MEIGGGYDFEFVVELSAGQKCPICLFAMRDAVQTKCGHRYCESCLLRSFRENNERVCPQDRIHIPVEKGIFPDRACDRDILSLRVKCKRSRRGCTWIGELRHYQNHSSTMCQNEDIACKDCDAVMQRMEVASHMTFDCLKREVQCDYCDEVFAFCNIKEHKDNECTRFPMDCPQRCGVRKIAREEVELHVRGDCLMTRECCPYQEIGCNFVDNRCKMKNHIKESNEHHLSLTSRELTRANKKVDKLEELTTQLVKDNEMLKKEIKRLSNKHAEEERKGDVKQMNNFLGVMGNFFNQRKKKEQSVPRNKRRKEDEVFQSSPKKNKDDKEDKDDKDDKDGKDL